MTLGTKLGLLFVMVFAGVVGVLIVDNFWRTERCKQAGGVLIRGHCVQPVKLQ